MSKESTFETAAKWFKKLNKPTSGMYQISHAARVNSAEPFQPVAVVEMIRRTKRERMAEHRLAVAELSTTPPVRQKKR